MQSFFIADTHFGHKNIVKGISQWTDKSACRKFNHLHEHDDLLINNINNTVGQNDRLYILGDFSFGGKENIPIYRERIVCKDVVLIRGNHDLHMMKNSVVMHNNKYINVNSLFSNVYDLLDFKIGKTNIVLCHFPILSWHRQSKGSIHLYGHVHKELNFNDGAICVSAECNNFKPFSFDQIQKIISNRLN